MRIEPLHLTALYLQEDGHRQSTSLCTSKKVLTFIKLGVLDVSIGRTSNVRSAAGHTDRRARSDEAVCNRQR